jgi:hypothetical protein
MHAMCDPLVTHLVLICTSCERRRVRAPRLVRDSSCIDNIAIKFVDESL